MKRLKPIELFLAVSVATTLISCSAPQGSEGGEASSDAKVEQSTEKSTETGKEGSAAQGSEGGEASEDATPIATPTSEGGEGGEGGAHGTGVQNNADLLTSLALMKGHLIAAQDLIAEKNYEAALPHIGHPAEEIYGSISEYLKTVNIQPFDTELNTLLDTMKTAPDSEAAKEQLQTVNETIEKAIAAIPAAERESPDFMVGVILKLLRTAADEYQGSIVDGQFAEVIEYQDSRGFVIYANQLFQTISPQLDATQREQFEAAFTELLRVWPSVNPPEKPIVEPGEVSAIVSKLELSR